MTNLKEFLLKLNKDLNLLREREAKQAGDAPLGLLNQIDDHKKAIGLTRQAIEGKLSQAEWRAALGPLNLAEPGFTWGQRINNFFFGSGQLRGQRNRQVMLNAVSEFWVKGVLENSLHRAVLIELGLEVKREAVEYLWEMVLQSPNQPGRSLPPESWGGLYLYSSLFDGVFCFAGDRAMNDGSLGFRGVHQGGAPSASRLNLL